MKQKNGYEWNLLDYWYRVGYKHLCKTSCGKFSSYIHNWWCIWSDSRCLFCINGEGCQLSMRSLFSCFGIKSKKDLSSHLLIFFDTSDHILPSPVQQVSANIVFPKLQSCQCCDQMSKDLTKIDSGHLLCLTCLRELRDYKKPLVQVS